MTSSEAAGSQAKQRKPAGRPRREALHYGPLADWLGFRLRMGQLASFQAFARLAQELDVSPGRFATLMLIGENPGIGPAALARALRSDKSTFTAAIGTLVRSGLVQREPDPADRRAFRLHLTAEGAAVLRRLTACARKHERRLDRLVGARDRARVLAALRRLDEGL